MYCSHSCWLTTKRSVRCSCRLVGDELERTRQLLAGISASRGHDGGVAAAAAGAPHASGCIDGARRRPPLAPRGGRLAQAPRRPATRPDRHSPGKRSSECGGPHLLTHTSYELFTLSPTPVSFARILTLAHYAHLHSDISFEAHLISPKTRRRGRRRSFEYKSQVKKTFYFFIVIVIITTRSSFCFDTCFAGEAPGLAQEFHDNHSTRVVLVLARGESECDSPGWLNSLTTLTVPEGKVQYIVVVFVRSAHFAIKSIPSITVLSALHLHRVLLASGTVVHPAQEAPSYAFQLSTQHHKTYLRIS